MMGVPPAARLRDAWGGTARAAARSAASTTRWGHLEPLLEGRYLGRKFSIDQAICGSCFVTRSFVPPASRR